MRLRSMLLQANFYILLAIAILRHYSLTHMKIFTRILASACFLFLVLVPSFSALAEEAKPPTSTQTTEAPYEEPKLGYFDWLLNFPGDFAAVGHQMWQKDQILPFSAMAASTALLIKYDYELWHPLAIGYHNSDGTVKHLGNLGASLGKGDRQLFLGAGFLAFGAIAGNHRAIRTASQIAEGIITTGTVDQVMKHLIGRQSPDSVTTVRTGRWQPFTSPATFSHHVSAYDAYPSGHVLTAFATEEVIRRNYPEQTWIPYVGYPIVALVGYGMVATSGHWWSDYPISLFIGWHFAKAITRNNAESHISEKQKEKDASWDINIYEPIPHSAGLAFTHTL